MMNRVKHPKYSHSDFHGKKALLIHNGVCAVGKLSAIPLNEGYYSLGWVGAMHVENVEWGRIGEGYPTEAPSVSPRSPTRVLDQKQTETIRRYDEKTDPTIYGEQGVAFVLELKDS